MYMMCDAFVFNGVWPFTVTDGVSLCIDYEAGEWYVSMRVMESDPTFLAAFPTAAAAESAARLVGAAIYQLAEAGVISLTAGVK